VGRAGFVSYETAHAQLITMVVGPAMLVEILAATAMVALRPKAVPTWAAWTGLALVGVIWASTAFIQVPMHNVLGRGFDADAHAHLVSTNWIRTIAWSARAARGIDARDWPIEPRQIDLVVNHHARYVRSTNIH
jgi:hypothetical protein